MPVLVDYTCHGAHSSGNSLHMSNTNWQQPWEKRHRTVKTVCVACMKISFVTLYGTPSEYRTLVGKEKCIHCGGIGKLSATGLAKTRVKRDTTSQLSLNWKKENQS